MKYHIKTFGCQMNHSDSERIAGFLESQPHPNPCLPDRQALLIKEKGFIETRDINKAELVIFNTCGVRQSAENRVYGQIHNLRKIRPEIKIILTGCLANRKDVRKRLKNKGAIFLPINELFDIGNWNFIGNWKLEIGNLNPLKTDCSYLKTTPKPSNAHTAYVPIMTGCNNFCSYCVVPYARGREVSRPADEIISEIKSLIKNGCKEIVLLGQNVNSYQFIDRNSSADEADSTINFSNLLKKVNSIPSHFWIWFVSNHPKDFSDELIETIVKCEKVCECVHLPVQAGDDKVLADMNRKYTGEYYLKLVRKIKSAFREHKPEAPYSITSDIIVGFPGETKKQFMESARIMEKVGYDMVYFGQFSPRPGTAAWRMKDSVSKVEKERRENCLNEILKKTTGKNNQKYLNETLEVLVDKLEAKPRVPRGLASSDFIYFGRTRTMKNVKFYSKKKKLIGQFVKVKITKANTWNLEGSLI